jgi:hypothetical protein
MKRRSQTDFVLFDVTYVDGSQTSRRKVLRSVVDSLDGEAAVKATLEAQDREIGLASGRSRGEIRSLARSRM